MRGKWWTLVVLPAVVLGSSQPGSLFLPEVSRFLADSVDTDDFRLDHFSRALQSLASTQNALKSVDGLTHQFKNAFTDYSTLKARYKTFKRKRRKNAKEATKLFEYVNTMERAFQATEILQSVSERNLEKRKKMLEACGLLELKRVPLSCQKFKCSMTILHPLQSLDDDSGKYKPGEMIVAFTDGEHMKVRNILRLLSKKEKVLALRAVGLVNEETSVQPALMRMAKESLAELKEYLSPPPLADNATFNATESSSPDTSPRFLRIVGYSIGGGISALTTMILDGSLSLKDEELDGFIGLYKDRVKSLCIGCPPCISRSVVSRNVLTVICGDDCVPRATCDTIKHFQDRVVDGLRKGAGKRGIGGLGYKLGPGLLGDITAVAGARHCLLFDTCDAIQVQV